MPLVYLKFWCANVEKDFYWQQIYRKYFFHSFHHENNLTQQKTTVSFAKACLIYKLKYQTLSGWPPAQSFLLSDKYIKTLGRRSNCYQNYIDFNNNFKRYKTSRVCVELTCCVISSRYNLELKLECVLWSRFLQKIVINLFQSFWNFLRLNTLYTKGYSTFLRFAFVAFFLKLFLFQSKTKYAVKDIIQIIFMSNKLNEKKSEYRFLKKLICEHLTL